MALTGALCQTLVETLHQCPPGSRGIGGMLTSRQRYGLPSPDTKRLPQHQLPATRRPSAGLGGDAQTRNSGGHPSEQPGAH
jgi:hypothetical protein